MPSVETSQTLQPRQRSNFAWAMSDALVLIGRSLRHIVRNMDQLLSVLIQPIMFMLLFRYVFGGSIDTGSINYVNFLFAGILIQTLTFGATTTAIGVSNDLQRGIINRFKSLPMQSSAVLIGHTVADLARNILSSIVMLIVALLVGFRPQANALEWLMILGIILLFTLAISWLSAILGLLAKTIEGVQWVSFVVVFPLTFASSAFAPTSNMPGWLQAFAANQPINQVIEAVRAPLVNQPIGNHGWLAVLWCLGFLAIAVPLSGWLFRRRAIK